MTGYRQGDVILLPFPFTNLAAFKQRPALIISSDQFNRTHGDIIAAAITSHLTEGASQNEYRLNKTEQIAAGLPKPSLIKLGKIVTIDQRLIRKKLGQLPEKSLKAISAGIGEIFNIS